MGKEFKEGMYVKVLSREGNILNKYGNFYKGNPIGRIKKVQKYTNSKYKYKVRIAPETYIYCTEKEIKDYKIEK